MIQVAEFSFAGGNTYCGGGDTESHNDDIITWPGHVDLRVGQWTTLWLHHHLNKTTEYLLHLFTFNNRTLYPHACQGPCNAR